MSLNIQNNVNIIIQGPLHHHCLDNIDEYKKYGNVIISCYKSDNADLIRVAKSIDNIKIILNELPKISCYNNWNAYYHCFSTLSGLACVNNGFAIKFRTDEKYSDISKFIDKVINNPNKIVTNNVAFVRNNVNPLHPSDHVMGGNVQAMKHIFSYVINLCSKLEHSCEHVDSKILNVSWMGGLIIEQLFCLAYIDYKYKNLDLLKNKPNQEELRKLMIDNYELVSVEDMGDVVHSINVGGVGRVFRKNDEGLYGYPHESIRKIEDI